MTSRRLPILAALLLFALVATVLVGCSTSTAPVNPPSTVPAYPGAVVPSATPSAAASATTPAKQSGHTVVSVKDFYFSPANVTIKVGAQVIWQNDGKVTHSIVFDNGSVKSPDIASGAVAGHLFKHAGTFAYHCGHHPQMKGTITVK